MKLAACIFVVCALAFTSAKRCETFCTREYRPVCGTDGESFKTFPNSCALRNEHCKDGHEWMQTRTEDCQNFELEERPKNCRMFCPAIFAPVCGFDGHVYKQFPNKCEMESYNCLYHNKWMQTRIEDCQNVELEEKLRCETPCRRDFKSVCGTDGENFKLFNNLCMLNNEHCKDGHSWFQTRLESCAGSNDQEVEEEEQRPKNCRLFCPAIFAPVCGFDGQAYKQFASKCMLESNNCLYHNNWAVVSLNKCA